MEVKAFVNHLVDCFQYTLYSTSVICFDRDNLSIGWLVLVWSIEYMISEESTSQIEYLNVEMSFGEGWVVRVRWIIIQN